MKGGRNTTKYPNIENERIKSRITKQSMAAKIGVSTYTLKSWQSGKSEIPATKIVALAELFGVTTDYILGRTKTTP